MRYVIDSQGKPVAVLLDIEEYHQLLQRLQLTDSQVAPDPTTLSDEKWQRRWKHFLARARKGVCLPDEALSRENIYNTRDVAD